MSERATILRFDVFELDRGSGERLVNALSLSLTPREQQILLQDVPSKFEGVPALFARQSV